jgi:hypothetical protein
VVSCTHGHYYVPFERYPTLENWLERVVQV